MAASKGSGTYQLRVISGPSGGGKSTLVQRLMKECGDCFAFSISHTTRKPRPGEVDGKDYHFVTREKMQKMIDQKEFLEYAEFSGNMYGTSKKAVNDASKSGKICILDVEIQGVKSIKKTDLNPIYIFVKPPNMEVLKDRLTKRGTETEDSLNKRLATANEAMEFAAQPGNYNHVIVNGDLETAYKELRALFEKDMEDIKKKSKSK